jgi:hypothetical protein
MRTIREMDDVTGESKRLALRTEEYRDQAAQNKTKENILRFNRTRFHTIQYTV